MWEKYDEATMGIVVRHIKRFGNLHLLKHLLISSLSSGLPDNVFEPGERPPKLVQKRVKVGTLIGSNWFEQAIEFHDRKGSSKSSNTSPDMPNKRQRLVNATVLNLTTR